MAVSIVKRSLPETPTFVKLSIGGNPIFFERGRSDIVAVVGLVRTETDLPASMNDAVAGFDKVLAISIDGRPIIVATAIAVSVELDMQHLFPMLSPHAANQGKEFIFVIAENHVEFIHGSSLPAWLSFVNRNLLDFTRGSGRRRSRTSIKRASSPSV